jgi:hypothetical protein
VAVCEEISKKIKQAGTLKIRKAPSVQCKIQGIEASFREAHDWVNNTGVGVLERDGPISFEETVTTMTTLPLLHPYLSKIRMRKRTIMSVLKKGQKPKKKKKKTAATQPQATQPHQEAPAPLVLVPQEPSWPSTAVPSALSLRASRPTLCQ